MNQFKIDQFNQIDNLTDKVCAVLNIDKKILRSKSRKRTYFDVRIAISHVCYRHYKHTLVSIGSYFSNRHHSTIIQALESRDNLIVNNDKFKQIEQTVMECADLNNRPVFRNLKQRQLLPLPVFY